MAFWHKLFGKSQTAAAERAVVGVDNVDEAELSAYRLRSFLDQIIECRQTYSSTSDRAIERRMAEEFRQLTRRIDAVLDRVTNRREIEVVLDTFVSSLVIDVDGKQLASHIEGRVIWVEDTSSRGIQRVITQNLSRFGKIWLKVLTTRLHDCGKELLRGGDSATHRNFECYANFILLTNTDVGNAALRKELERFQKDDLDRTLDPFSKIRDALGKGRTQLTGSWNDHWEGD